MTFGIRIENDAGTVQIDSEAQNWELRGWGSVSPASSSSPHLHQDYVGDWRIAPTWSPQQPYNSGIFVYSCAEQYAYYVGTAFDSGFSTHAFRMSGTSWTIKYWMFDANPYPTVSGFGIAIKGDMGQNTFNTDQTTIMKIRDMKSITTISDENWTMPSGSKYGVVSMPGGYCLMDGGSRRAKLVGHQVDGNIVRKRTVDSGASQTANQVVSAPTWIVDVTGLPNA